MVNGLATALTGSGIVTKIIEILTSGFSGIATGMAPQFSTLIEGIFLNSTKEDLSTFGAITIAFMAVSLGLGLIRWVLNFVTSLGARNR